MPRSSNSLTQNIMGDFAQQVSSNSRVGLVCPPLPRRAHRPALILLFAKKFFRSPSRTGGFRNRFAAITEPKSFKTGSSVTLANEVERSNILAPGLPPGTRPTHLLPAFTPERFRGLALGSRIQLQQRNCSRFARDFSRRSTFSSSQRTESISSDFSLAAQDLFRICRSEE